MTSEEKNINTIAYWNRRWKKETRWVKNKRKYRLLNKVLPRFTLKHKPRRKYYPHIARLAAELGCKNFCDLACGSGITAGIYSLMTGRRSFGLDFSIEGISLARKEAQKYRVPCFFAVGSIYQVPCKDGVFGAVYLGQEHLDDDKGAVREALRLVKPSGHLIISVPVKGKTKAEDHISLLSLRFCTK